MIIEIGSKEVDCANGIIATGLCGEDSVVHEFRHHIQFLKRGYDWDFTNHEICPFEKDAFTFEFIMALMLNQGYEHRVRKNTGKIEVIDNVFTGLQ